MTTLKRGVTHPTIHMDYYEWLNKINKDSFAQEFIKNHSKNYQDFHAIAMWVWSASREELKLKVDKEIKYYTTKYPTGFGDSTALIGLRKDNSVFFILKNCEIDNNNYGWTKEDILEKFEDGYWREATPEEITKYVK